MPTWNYVVVHVYASFAAIHDLEVILSIPDSLITCHEAAQPHPWQIADAPKDFTERLVDHIV